jgi:hypothetical protein
VVVRCPLGAQARLDVQQIVVRRGDHAERAIDPGGGQAHLEIGRKDGRGAGVPPAARRHGGRRHVDDRTRHSKPLEQLGDPQADVAEPDDDHVAPHPARPPASGLDDPALDEVGRHQRDPEAQRHAAREQADRAHDRARLVAAAHGLRRWVAQRREHPQVEPVRRPLDRGERDRSRHQHEQPHEHLGAERRRGEPRALEPPPCQPHEIAASFRKARRARGPRRRPAGALAPHEAQDVEQLTADQHLLARGERLVSRRVPRAAERTTREHLAAVTREKLGRRPAQQRPLTPPPAALDGTHLESADVDVLVGEPQRHQVLLALLHERRDHEVGRGEVRDAVGAADAKRNSRALALDLVGQGGVEGAHDDRRLAARPLVQLRDHERGAQVLLVVVVEREHAVGSGLERPCEVGVQARRDRDAIDLGVARLEELRDGGDEPALAEHDEAPAEEAGRIGIVGGHSQLESAPGRSDTARVRARRAPYHGHRQLPAARLADRP